MITARAVLDRRQCFAGRSRAALSMGASPWRTSASRTCFKYHPRLTPNTSTMNAEAQAPHTAIVVCDRGEGVRASMTDGDAIEAAVLDRQHREEYHDGSPTKAVCWKRDGTGPLAGGDDDRAKVDFRATVLHCGSAASPPDRS